MKYECVSCDYETDIKNNYDRHIKGVKHNSEKELCKYCDCPFSNMNKHYNDCTYKGNYEAKLELQNTTLKNTIKSLEQQLAGQKNLLNNSFEQQLIAQKDGLSKSYESRINSSESQLIAQKQSYDARINSLESQLIVQKESYEARINSLESQLSKQEVYLNTFMQNNTKHADFLMQRTTNSDTKYEKLIENTGIFANNSLNTINNTVSALKYIQTNYNNAPALKALSNYNCFKKTTTDKFIPELLHYYKNDLLVKYIGDTYIQEYLKDNPAEQAMWNSDHARLSYYIRESSEGELTYDEWVQDKQGLKIIEITIKPILKFLYDEVSAYMNKKVNEGDYKLMESCAKLKEFLNGTPQKKPMGKIVRSLPEEIVKYIGPKFLINKSKKPIKYLTTDKNTVTKPKQITIEEYAEEELELELDQDQDQPVEQLEEDEEVVVLEEPVEDDLFVKYNLHSDNLGICEHYQEKEEEIYDINRRKVIRTDPKRVKELEKLKNKKPKKLKN
jgi:uncharacterized coiled-coil protein SlyX